MINRRIISVEAFLALCLIALFAGGALQLASHPGGADVSWAIATVAAIIPSSAWVAASLKHRRPGVDVIAVLALIGALVVHEYLAGCVIATMLATGRLLESRAQTRATRDLTALLDRSPRFAHRLEDGNLVDVPIDMITPGDHILVRPGEVVPADGRVEKTAAVLDESMLTGEPIPVEHPPGDAVRSGSVNTSSPLELLVTRPASQSAYAEIIRLVEDAQRDTAPFVRMADRYAAAFLPLTLTVAAFAWALSGDATRAVAVLVVATPCPLILAAPVAIVSGLSRCARRGVIIKSGDALEPLSRGQVLLFDKTGTLTEGRPVVTKIVSPSIDPALLLTMAASLDQVSPHVLASSIVRAAMKRNLTLTTPSDVVEIPGLGIFGRVNAQVVSVGKADWIKTGLDEPDWMRATRRRADAEGAVTIFIALDGTPAGALMLQDRVRADAARVIRKLHAAGIKRTAMVTGDRAEVGELVGTALGIDDIYTDRTPAEKVDVVNAASAYGNTIMVGDGVNDAPALATASVGVAIGTQGRTASSQTADVVLTVGRLDRIAEAMEIARRSRTIATQSVVVGMSLSLVAMIIAAFGFLTPTAGALLQEAIDVAVILNALRALAETHHNIRLSADDTALTQRFAAEHRELWPNLDVLRHAAESLGSDDLPAGLTNARHAHALLMEKVLPHEDAEHAELYPALGALLGNAEATGPMTRAHIEIRHLTHRLGRLLDEVTEPADAEDVHQLQQILYALHAILSLHFQQEEESYFSLVDDPVPVTR